MGYFPVFIAMIETGGMPDVNIIATSPHTLSSLQSPVSPWVLACIWNHGCCLLVAGDLINGFTKCNMKTKQSKWNKHKEASTEWTDLVNKCSLNRAIDIVSCHVTFRRYSKRQNAWMSICFWPSWFTIIVTTILYQWVPCIKETTGKHEHIQRFSCKHLHLKCVD